MKMFFLSSPVPRPEGQPREPRPDGPLLGAQRDKEAAGVHAGQPAR